MAPQYYTAASLDGFIATENDSLEWPTPIGDLQESSDPAFIAAVGALAMGSTTDEWILAHVDEVAAQTGAAWRYTQPEWIFTRRALPHVHDADVRLVHGDVRPVHLAMREAADHRNIWIVGRGDLPGQFFDAGLLDELIVEIGSVTLASGKPLLPRRLLAPALRLQSVERFGADMVELHSTVQTRQEVGRSDQGRDSAITPTRATD